MSFYVILLYTLWRLCEGIFKKIVQVVSEKIYKKALKVQILNKVALIQVVRKQVISFQDRKNGKNTKIS